MPFLSLRLHIALAWSIISTPETFQRHVCFCWISGLSFVLPAYHKTLYLVVFNELLLSNRAVPLIGFTHIKIMIIQRDPELTGHYRQTAQAL